MRVNGEGDLGEGGSAQEFPETAPETQTLAPGRLFKRSPAPEKSDGQVKSLHHQEISTWNHSGSQLTFMPLRGR